MHFYAKLDLCKMFQIWYTFIIVKWALFSSFFYNWQLRRMTIILFVQKHLMILVQRKVVWKLFALIEDVYSVLLFAWWIYVERVKQVGIKENWKWKNESNSQRLQNLKNFKVAIYTSRQFHTSSLRLKLNGTSRTCSDEMIQFRNQFNFLRHRLHKAFKTLILKVTLILLFFCSVNSTYVYVVVQFYTGSNLFSFIFGYCNVW